MIRNYFKTAWRTISKDRNYTIINVVGLTIGLCACMLAGTVVLDDLSYDQAWTNKNDLYRIVTVDNNTGGMERQASALANLGNELKNNFPEVKAAASVNSSRKILLRKQETDDETIAMDIFQADTNVWKMLDLHVLNGNPQQYIAGVGNLVITEAFRDTHFKGENPIGKTIYEVSAYRDKATPYQITGVMANLPNNSYLRAEGMLVSRPLSMELSREGWGFFDEQMVLMTPNTDMVRFAEKANRWYREFLTDASEKTLENIPTYEFQPITDIYLHSDFAYQRVKGSIQNIYIFSVTAALLLTIACINFVNLTTARAIRRLRETGVRKVLGAGRIQLVKQFLTESLLFFAISTILALLFYTLSIHALESFIGYSLTLNFLDSYPLLFSLFGVTLFISLLTGSYPAWVMSGFKVNFALRNKLGMGKSTTNANVVRQSLVVAQFFIAILVLIGMLTIRAQVHYMEQKPLGYQPENVAIIQWFSTEGKGDAFRHALGQQPGIGQVSLTRWVPMQGKGSWTKRADHPAKANEQMDVNFIAGEANLSQVLGFELLHGEWLQNSHAGAQFIPDRMDESAFDSLKTAGTPIVKALVTVSTAKLFNISDEQLGQPHKTLGVIPVGVISDFHSQSLRDPISPTVIIAEADIPNGAVLVKIEQGREREALAGIDRVWKDFYPYKPSKLDWLDDLVNQQYEREQKQAQLFSLFSACTLFLAALGVFGLVVHATQQRVQEIGIRKVLGASVSSIVRLFSLDYVKLVSIALCVASPVAWYAMKKWLENFAYRIDIQWWMFAVAGLVAVVIALFTVSWQAIRAAVANPVDSLRDE